MLSMFSYNGRFDFLGVIYLTAPYLEAFLCTVNVYNSRIFEVFLEEGGL